MDALNTPTAGPETEQRASPEAPEAGPFAGDAILGQPQRWWFLPLLVLSWFGSAVVYGAVVGASMPKLLTLWGPESKEVNLAIIASIGGIVVMIITPLFGRLSDRTTSAWGMRKPWFLGGFLVGTAGIVLQAFADSIWLLVLGWCVTQIGYGAVAMANHTLLADQVPQRIRARVAAATGVGAGVATVVGVAVVAALPLDQSWTWFIVPGAIGLLTTVPMLFGYRDAVRTDKPAPLRFRDLLSTYWLNPAVYRDFAWAWTSRFFMTMSILSIALYLFFLIVETLGYSVEEAGGVQTTALACFFAGNVVAMLFFGWLSDRLGRRKLIVWTSGIVSGSGVLLLMVSPDMPTFLIAISIVGFAQGAYLSVDVALMTEVLPSFQDAGKDLGIVALAYQLPQVLAPFAVALCIGLAGGSYLGLYLLSILCSVLGGVTIIPVRGVK
ncbi:MAG: MFS transporter [Renibacterium sp.]|nr:MFS transporter [Renibacterium sp.]